MLRTRWPRWSTPYLENILGDYVVKKSAGGVSNTAVYTTDLHGSAPHYKEALDLAVKNRARWIFIGGDITAHDTSDYQRDQISDQIIPQLYKFHEAHPNIEIYIMMGNNDWAVNMDLLEAAADEEILRLLHKKKYKLAGTDKFVAGYCCVDITPFDRKDWDRWDDRNICRLGARLDGYLSAPEWQRVSLDDDRKSGDTIAAGLKKLGRRTKPARTIYVMHAPPANCGLDVTRFGEHVGSQAMRAFIEKRQPYLTLCGHVHESPVVSDKEGNKGRWAEIINGAFVVNPGQHKDKLHAVVFDVNEPRQTIWHSILKKF